MNPVIKALDSLEKGREYTANISTPENSFAFHFTAGETIDSINFETVEMLMDALDSLNNGHGYILITEDKTPELIEMRGLILTKTETHPLTGEELEIGYKTIYGMFEDIDKIVFVDA